MSEQPYVSPAPLPGAYERELLDVIGEEAVEIAEAALNTAAATGWDSAPPAAHALAMEIGDLAHAAELASSFLPEMTTSTKKAEPREFDRRAVYLRRLVEAALTLSIRASKARRFGCAEVQPGQQLNNAERVGIAIADVRTMTAHLLELDLIQERAIKEGASRKKRQLRKFMQHDPDGTRRS